MPTKIESVFGATDAASVAFLHWQTAETGSIESVKVDSEDRRIAASLELPGTGDADAIARQLSYDAPAKSFKASSKLVEMPLSHRAAYPGRSEQSKGKPAVKAGFLIRREVV